MSKFTPFKRVPFAGGGPPPTKARGSLSALNFVAAPPLPKANSPAQSKPPNGPIVIAVDKYTSEAQDVVPTFHPDEQLWVLRVDHNAFPNILSAVIAGSNAFLADMKAADDTMPGNLQELRQKEQIIFQIGRNDANNKDNLPLVEFSLAIYIGGTLAQLRNSIHFVVDFIYHRCTHANPAVDKSPWPVPGDIAIHVHPRTGIDLTGLDIEVTKMALTLHPPALVLPLSLWSTNPPGGSRALMVEIEIVDETHAIVAFDGRTYVFRARFDQALIPRVQGDLRLLPEELRDFAVVENRERILQIFGKLVLRDLVCCVRVTGVALPATGAVADMIASLKTKPNLFFEAF